MESKANTHKGESRKCRRNVQNDLYVEIGKRLRISRIELNYTQEQMAEILEMSSAYYGKVERGLHGLSLEKLVIVNKKPDMDINYLLTRTKRGEISLGEIMEQCPKSKRSDMEILIKCAMNLAKSPE